MKSLLLAILSFAVAAPLSASLIVDSGTPHQFGSPGETLTFTGTFTNDDQANTVFLNGFDLSINSVDLAGNGLDAFLDHVPISLAPGETSEEMVLFTITIADQLSGDLGQYFGAYTLYGGSEDASDNLGQLNFSVTVTPEPSSLTLAGVAILAFAVRRKLILRILLRK